MNQKQLVDEIKKEINNARVEIIDTLTRQNEKILETQHSLDKKPETSENISKEEQIIETLKTSVIQVIENEMLDLYKGNGYDTLEDTRTHVLELFDKLGLVSISLDSNKAIIYCLNPYELIDSKSLWTYCQAKIKEKHNYILCAALFKLDKETDFGVNAYSWTSPSLKKLWKR